MKIDSSANTSFSITIDSPFAGLANFNRQIFTNNHSEKVALSIAKNLNAKQALCGIGDHLILAAEHTRITRNADKLDEVLSLFAFLPLPQPYKAVAQYYEALK